MAQLVPLPLTVSCSSKSRLVLLFWYRLTPVVLDKGPLNGCIRIYFISEKLVSCVMLCDRFCAYDAHGLYQRIDCLAREYMVKRKSCFTQLYKTPASDGISAGDAGQTSSNIISALLQEYDALKRCLETVSPALLPLVRYCCLAGYPDRRLPWCTWIVFDMN